MSPLTFLVHSTVLTAPWAQKR